MKKQYIILFLLLVSILSASGCGKKDTTPTIPLWSIDNDGFTRFYTKDESYYGHSFWQWNNAIISDPMGYVETSVIKVSGNPYYGYGIVFCLQDTYKFYRLLIDTEGNFYISKRENDLWTHDLTNRDGKWDEGTYLNTGYNVLNKIKVVREPDSSTFTVYFNDKKETTFTDSTFSGGKFGFYANVGENDEEDFPNNPVDVRFKQLYPIKSSSMLSSQSLAIDNDPAVSFDIER